MLVKFLDGTEREMADLSGADLCGADLLVPGARQVTYEVSMMYCADLECWRAVIYRGWQILMQADGKTQRVALMRARAGVRTWRKRQARQALRVA